jgi:uncharacterized tellurite resistance protein B-like protein
MFLLEVDKRVEITEPEAFANILANSSKISEEEAKFLAAARSLAS